jgi:predicted Kef-type K+ transport protein
MKQKLMMKQPDNNIEEQVAKTMKLLDEMKPLKVNHFFRARLMQRIDREFGPGMKQSHALTGNRFMFRLAFFALLIIINLGSAVLSVQQNNRGTTSGSGLSEMLDKMSDDYASNEFAYYDQSGSSTPETVTNENQTP